jgi:hypothetical protein
MTVIRRSATVCTGCWQVVAIDGENNRERIGALCSHLAPMVEVVPSTDTPGAVSREHAVQAIGWLSAEVAVHGAPSLGPEWLELWDRALTATEGQ